MRGLDVTSAVTTGVNASLIIGEYNDDVWLACMCPNEGSKDNGGNKEWIK